MLSLCSAHVGKFCALRLVYMLVFRAGQTETPEIAFILSGGPINRNLRGKTTILISFSTGVPKFSSFHLLFSQIRK